MMHRKIFFTLVIGILFLLGSCAPANKADIPSSPASTITVSPALTSTPNITPLPPTPTLAPDSAFIKAVALNNFGPRLDTIEAREIINNFIIPTGANYIALVPTCWSKDPNDITIVCSDEYDPRMIPPVSDEELISAIQYSHSVGLRVFMKPQALIRSYQIEQHYGTRGKYWSSAKWTEWFDSYINFITHYAQMAEDNHVELFTVGEEQADTLQHDADWRRVIAAVRAVYHGKITYGAGAYPFEASQVQFWDALDYIGVQGYYGMLDQKNPTIAEMEAAWIPMLHHMEALSKQYGKQVIETEIGYRSAKDFSISFLHGKGDFINQPYDGQGQADYYTAFFEALKDLPWLKGIVLWDVYTNPFAEGINDISSSFIGKPAEQVVHQYFGGTPIITNTISSPVEDPLNSMTIYGDNLLNGWHTEHNQNATDFPYIYFKEPHSGLYSVHVPLLKAFEFMLYRNDALDMSKYKWLEFYIMVGKNPPKTLNVVFASWFNEVNSWSSMSREVPVNDPNYIEGGKYVPGTWQKVRIPLADLNISNQVITELHIYSCIFNCKPINNVDDIYLDDIQLVAGKP